MSNWIKVSENEEPNREADLRDWFKKEKWIDLRRPKKDGGYEACGRGDTSKGKKPVCTPANKAKGIDKKERTQRLKEKAKKEKEPNPDKKPNVTKYSPGAGGKSNISHSDSANIKFSNSMINLRNAWKEIKIAVMGEEEEPVTTEMPSFMQDLGQDRAHLVTEKILKAAQSQINMMNVMLDEELKIEDVTDANEQGNVISLLWNRAMSTDDDDVSLVLEYLSNYLDNHSGESVFNYATLKEIAEEVFFRY